MATLDSDDRIYLEALLIPLQQNDARFERAIFGNGRPGLISDVASLKVEKKRNRLNAAGIGTVAGAVVSVIAQMWKS